MKKLTSMALSVILVFLFVFAFFAQNEPNVHAEVYTADTAYREAIEDELDRLDTLDLSSESRATAEGKLNFMLLTEAERTAIVQASMPRSFYDLKKCNVPHFRQERSDYCGPATAKQTIHYLTDGAISPTQDEIAPHVGMTDPGEEEGEEGSYSASSQLIRNWLEDYGFYYYSVNVSTMSTRDIVNYVVADIGTYDNPCFGGVTANNQAVSSGYWPYYTGGHILNISGIIQYEPDYQNSSLQFTDPYITWADTYNTTGKHYVSLLHYNEVKTSFWW